jgi:hypothetical protein
MSYSRIEAWLLKPWNAALSLWALTWGALLLFGVVDHLRPEHSDQSWRVGWAWILIIAGLPMSPLALPLLEHTATLELLSTPVGDFLFAWLILGATSFVFWLILVPLVYRRLTAGHPRIGL